MDWTELRSRLQKEGAVSLRIKAIPKSQKTEAVGFLADGCLKVKVAAVPEKGKANAELCEYLAEVFGVSKRNVTVLAGETSHNKVLRVAR